MKKGSAMSWWIWALTVTFLFYEFFIRVFPTAMVKELMAAFSVTAGTLGTLSAFYFYAYAPMQLPVGILMDRFGARKLLTFASLICALGSFMFALAPHLPMAELGRLFMGIGSAFGFVGMVYVSSHWFPAEKLALLVGLGNSIGMLGAVGAEGPLAMSIDAVGWRFTLHIFGVFGVLLAIAIYFFIRREPQRMKRGEGKHATMKLFAKLQVVCSNYKTYLNAVIALLYYMTTAGFASLWGIPFLVQEYGMEKTLAGYAVSMIFVGWIVGGPLIGMISDKFSKRKPFLFGSIILTTATIVPVIYVEQLYVGVLFLLLFLVGFFSSAQLLHFSLAIELNPIEAKGTSIAMTNFIVAIGSSIIQPLLGYFLDLSWDGVIKNGVPFYSSNDYKQAMVTFPITLLLALFLLLFLKERKHTKEKIAKMIGLD
ncbi:MFS transporter [Simkania sp.]|uniref:MFS transporter n=1 Tax=Simkania sp. TaxID=34094 RepID=UPI003B51EBDE